MTALARLAGAALVALLAGLPAKAQTVACSGPTAGNCVPVVQIQSKMPAWRDPRG
jgi:hypothetical protein